VLDEAPALPGLLKELAAAGLLGAAVFVDNGSTDGSRALIAAAGARLLNESRRGYGYPCLTGLRAVSADAAAAPLCAGAEREKSSRPCPASWVVVFMEADGSDDPAEVRRLAQPVLDGAADLVIGSRRRAVRRVSARGALRQASVHRPAGVSPTTPAGSKSRCGGAGAHDAGMPIHQRLGNELSRLALRALFGLRIADNGPFRAVRLGLLEHLHMEPHGYAWTTEMTVKARLVGARITVLETAYRPRPGSSKIAGTLRGTLGAFAGIFGTMMRLRLCPPPGLRRRG
jgi:hypothetical protein